MRWIRTIGMLAMSLMIFSTYLWAQENNQRRPRYKVIDVGTFGGPVSVYNVLTRIATANGIVVGAADTDAPDPYPFACWDASCFVQHAYVWRKGELTDMGTLPGGSSSYTNAINTRGLIVGQSQNGELDPVTGIPKFIATVWDHDKIRNLGTLGGGFSIAVAVTDQNFVMGDAENGKPDDSGFGENFGFSQASEIHAFGWDGRKKFDLGSLGGPGAFGNDMNNLGQVVGVSPVTSIPGPLGIAPFAPFLWEKGRMQNLGNLGGTLGVASAINNRGQVVGASNLAGDLVTHPFLWERGKMSDLGTLGGDYGNAEWLSDAGDVIGISAIADQSLHAFLWKRGKMTDLGTVDGDNSSNAFGVNVKGQIVGQSWFWDGQNTTASHAFLWDGNGPMLDLNMLISNDSEINLIEADFITDRGLIVARGFLPNGDLHTTILIPDEERNDIGTNEVSADSAALAEQRNIAPLTPQMQAVLNARLAKYYRHDLLK
ncbi:hypothetical protein [Alloacidobacterium sp.]|uniref:hypothetical protein n=1 Tax=Alloacidobacterium sp. TaxID=2951999 RepID=UPI002D24D70F|nr:hypothetical protein [Alloacidobacterium sp.]HYK34511.1 hypothetical protein [Alloacidobacterium sp.]